MTPTKIKGLEEFAKKKGMTLKDMSYDAVIGRVGEARQKAQSFYQKYIEYKGQWQEARRQEEEALKDLDKVYAELKK